MGLRRREGVVRAWRAVSPEEFREALDTLVRAFTGGVAGHVEEGAAPEELGVEPYISVAMAAEYVSVSADTVRGWVSSGALPHYRAGNQIRLKRSDIDRFLVDSTAEAERLGGVSDPDEPTPEHVRTMIEELR